MIGLQEIWCEIMLSQDNVMSVPTKWSPKKRYQQFTVLGHVLEVLKKIVYFISYVISIAMNLRACLLMELSVFSFEFWTCIISTSCTTLMSLYLVILVCIQCFSIPPRQTPWLSKVSDRAHLPCLILLSYLSSFRCMPPSL